MKYKFLKIFLSLMLVFASIDLFVFAIDQDLTITSAIDYADDKSAATINLDVVPNTNIEIESITVDGRNVMIKDGSSIQAREIVTENQTVIFDISYVKDGEILVQHESVIVDRIESFAEIPVEEENFVENEEKVDNTTSHVVNASVNILRLIQDRVDMNVGELIDFNPVNFVEIVQGVDQNLINKVVVKSNVDRNKIGYYEVEFSVQDDAGNVSVVKLPVYVQGLPYLIDDENQIIPLHGMSEIKKREWDATRYFIGYHAVYDRVLEDGTIEEKVSIPIGYNDDSSYAVVTKVLDKLGFDVGSVTYKDPGIYEAYYEFSNPYGGVSYASRKILIRGELEVSDGIIEYASSNPIKNYNNFDEFYARNKDQINNFIAQVMTEEHVLDQYGELDSSIIINYVGMTKFSDYDFTELNPDGSPRTIVLQLVAIDNSLGFPIASVKLNVFVHVVKNTQTAPVITVNNPITYRLVSDEIKNGNQNVSVEPGVAFEDSSLYQMLMNYITVMDEEDNANHYDTVIDIVKIKEINQNIEVNLSLPTAQEEIIDLLRTPGIVEVTYQATDEGLLTSMAVKNFEIASEINFPDFENVMNVRQKIGSYYSPHTKVSYIDSSGVEMVVELTLDEFSLNTVMEHDVEFTVSQPYLFFPDSKILRPKVVRKQKIFTQGRVVFLGSQPLLYFVGDEVDLSVVQAGFNYISQKNVKNFQLTPVTNNVASETITSNVPGNVSVEFETEDKVTGINDGAILLKKTYGFVSKPMIHSKDKIMVNENESFAEMTQKMDIHASVILPNLVVKEISYSMNYKDVDPYKGGVAIIEARYTLPSGSEEVVQKSVRIDVSKIPTSTNQSSTQPTDVPTSETQPMTKPTMDTNQNPTNEEKEVSTQTPTQVIEEETFTEEVVVEQNHKINWWWVLLTIVITAGYTYYLTKDDE